MAMNERVPEVTCYVLSALIQVW